MTRPTLTPSERAVDRPRNEAFFILKAASIAIQSPGMTLDEVSHSIETVQVAMRKLELYEQVLADHLGVELDDEDDELDIVG